MRNASVAVMVANSVFRDLPNVMLMIALVVMLILVILLPYHLYLKSNRLRGKNETDVFC